MRVMWGVIEDLKHLILFIRVLFGNELIIGVEYTFLHKEVGPMVY